MKKICLLTFLCLWGITVLAQQSRFQIADRGKAAPIMVDPEIVVEQIVVNPDNSRYSYFGAGYKFTDGKTAK